MCTPVLHVIIAIMIVFYFSPTSLLFGDIADSYLNGQEVRYDGSES